MAESDVATAPLETSAGNNHTQDTIPPPEEGAAPPDQTAELEKEQKEEEVEVESEKAAVSEEAGEGNPDLKRKHEVQEEMERQQEGAGYGENITEAGEEREGAEAKRQRTETDEAQELGIYIFYLVPSFCWIIRISILSLQICIDLKNLLLMTEQKNKGNSNLTKENVHKQK